MNPHVVVRENVCAISGLDVGVFTEVTSSESARDPSAEAVAREVSQRFGELARRHSSFNRLRGLQELVGVSKALQELETPVDISWWLGEYPLPSINTPKEMPVVRRTYYANRSASGGVEMAALAIRVATGNVVALRQAVLDNRDRPDELKWEFTVGRWVIPIRPGHISPEETANLYSEAVFLATHDKHLDALSLFNLVLRTAPDSSEVWYNKGVVLYRLHRPEQALASFNQAIKLAPDYISAWINKGVILKETGQFLEAIDCYNQAMVFNPDDPETWHRKGEVLFELARPEETLECLDRAIELRPDYASAWLNKGTTLYDLGRLEEALACLSKATSLNERSALAWRHRALVLDNLNRPKEALHCASRAVELKPDWAIAWHDKGAALYKLNRLNEAESAYRKAAELGSTDSWRALGILLEKRQDRAQPEQENTRSANR